MTQRSWAWSHMMMTSRTLPDRMQGRFEYVPHSACWVWTGRRDRRGYGRYGDKGTLVHRVTYTRLVGEIPQGLEPDHLCRNTGCGNPEHLEPVTHAENLRRGHMTIWLQRRAVTHCPHGHEYAGDNLRHDRLGRRVCRACAIKKARVFRQRYGRRKQSAPHWEVEES